MSTSSQRLQQPPSPEKEMKIYNNPFDQRSRSKVDKASPEQFVRLWMEDIFYNCKKIEIQDKVSIFSKLASGKLSEINPYSTLLPIIRDKISELSRRLRSFFDHSYETLSSQRRNLCSLIPQVNQHPDNCITLPVSQIYVSAYRYMCDVAREAYYFWKLISEKKIHPDLRSSPVQQQFSNLILEIFTKDSNKAKPMAMLPLMPFPQKCRFVYVDEEGLRKRQELTRFYEDKTIQKLFKKNGKKEGISKQKSSKINEQYIQQRQNRRKGDSILHRHRLDYRDMKTQIERYMEGNSDFNQQLIFNSHFGNQPMPSSKTDIIRSLKSMNQKSFEIQDVSSQQDQQQPTYQRSDSKEQLIDEQDHVQIELNMNPEKLVQNRETEGSNKSQSNEDPCMAFDLPMRNYESQPPPPQFIIPQQTLSQEGFLLGVQRDRSEMQRALELLSHYNTQNSFNSDLEVENHERKLNRLKMNIAKSKQISQRQKRIQQLDKRHLQEEKEKLENYRRQLEKEKQQLLREVEKFMKDKKQSNLLVRENKARQKIRTAGKLPINHKIIHKNEKNRIQSLSYKHNQYLHDDEFDPEISQISHIMEDREKMKEIEQAIAKDLSENAKLSKKQQKLKKRIEREIFHEIQPKKDSDSKLNELEGKKEKYDRGGMTEQESNLCRFLDQLQIEDQGRLSCNVEEGLIEKWKNMSSEFLSGVDLPVSYQPVCLTKPPQAPQMKSSSKKKKKKGRR